MMAIPSVFVGRWNIESMDLWDTCVNLSLDCLGTGTKGTSLALTFIGDDEGDEVSGSGTAKVSGPDRITGKIRFHRGDESGFVARRAGGT